MGQVTSARSARVAACRPTANNVCRVFAWVAGFAVFFGLADPASIPAYARKPDTAGFDASYVNATSCRDLTRTHPEAPCRFDFSHYRMRDERLDAIEAKGFAGSGLFPGRSYTAHDAREVNRIARSLQPGDQLVLADGVWKDARIIVNAQGTSSRPILIRPQSTDGVTFTGSSSARFWGSDIVIDGLNFRDGIVDNERFTVVRLGGGAKRPCDRCIVNRVTVDNYQSAPEQYLTFEVIYLLMQGADITVANSRFTRKENVGPVIFSSHPIENQCAQQALEAHSCFQRLLFVDNFVSGVSRGKRQHAPRGKFKIMEIGAGHFATAQSFSVIEGNTFEHADGGTNTVDFKTCDVIVRNNRFLANLGTLNLRSTNRVLVENNTFDGTGEDGMGGVLIQGADHWVVHNRFRHLVHPVTDYHQPVAMTSGLYENLENGQRDYARVKDVVIADNILEDVAQPPIVMGIFPDPAKGRTLMPTKVYVLGNTFASPGASAKLAKSPSDEGMIDYRGGRQQFTDIMTKGNAVSR